MSESQKSALETIAASGKIHGGAWCAAVASEALGYGKTGTNQKGEENEAFAEPAAPGVAEGEKGYVEG